MIEAMAKTSSIADDKLEEHTEKYLSKNSEPAIGNTRNFQLLKQK